MVQVLNFDPDPYLVSPSPGMKLTPRSPGWDRASIWALASRPSGLSDRWDWDGIGMWCKNNCRQSSILTNIDIDIDIDVYIDLHMYMDYTLRLKSYEPICDRLGPFSIHNIQARPSAKWPSDPSRCWCLHHSKSDLGLIWVCPKYSKIMV